MNDSCTIKYFFPNKDHKYLREFKSDEYYLISNKCRFLNQFQVKPMNFGIKDKTKQLFEEYVNAWDKLLTNGSYTTKQKPIQIVNFSTCQK